LFGCDVLELDDDCCVPEFELVGDEVNPARFAARLGLTNELSSLKDDTLLASLGERDPP
jgi:hypothetical protein